MTTLILAEKNSAAADIASALGLKRAGDHYEGGDYLCIGAIGHLCQLLPVADVSKWGDLASLPLEVDEWEAVVMESTADRFKSIKALATRRDVTEVINACDAGREGELIFALIMEAAGVRKPMRRAWLQSMTEQGIREAFGSLREHDPRREAGARCRSIADFLVGINGTRGMSQLKRHVTGEQDIVQVGRVRNPVLGLVYDREYEIAHFKPKLFWRSVGQFISNKTGEGFEAELLEEDPWKGQTKEIAERLVASSATPEGGAIVFAEDVKTEGTRNPPSLYDLTSLQRKMNRQYGMSASETLEVVQALYEKHKLLSYPRTDSKKLPEDYHAKAAEAFGYLASCELLPDSLRAAFAGLEANAPAAVQLPGKRVFDNKGITDHFAIIPTSGKSSSGALSEVERNVFEAVCLVFCQAFHRPAALDKTVRTIALANKARFEVKGVVITDPGWLTVAGGKQEEEGEEGKGGEPERTLPPMDGPGSLAIKGVRSIETQTRRPPYFTEDTLLGAMEGAGRYVEAGEVSEALRERGLGTPATRGVIIESLLANKTPKGAPKQPDMGRDGKWLRITKKGASAIQELRAYGAANLCSPELTGEWELKLRAIESGDLAADQFLFEIKRLCAELVAPLQQKALTTPKHVEQPLTGACPACGEAKVRPQRYTYTCDCGGFKLFREVAQRAITSDEADELLKAGTTKVLKGFTSSKTNKKFDAGLKLDFDEEKNAHVVGFYFPEREAPVHFCTCGKGLVLRKGKTKGKAWKFWGCLGYSEGCKKKYEDVKGKPKI